MPTFLVEILLKMILKLILIPLLSSLLKMIINYILIPYLFLVDTLLKMRMILNLFLVDILLIMVLKPILTPIPFPIMIIITSLFLYILACYLHSLHRLFRVKIFPMFSDIYITCERFCTSCAKKCLIISTIYRRLAQVVKDFAQLES